MIWKPADILKLKTMRANGRTWGEIAAALGRTEAAVASYNRDRSRRIAAPPPKRKRPSPYMTTEEATEHLRGSVLLAIAGYANDNGIHIDHAAQILLSGAPVDNSTKARIHSGIAAGGRGI